MVSIDLVSALAAIGAVVVAIYAALVSRGALGMARSQTYAQMIEQMTEELSSETMRKHAQVIYNDIKNNEGKVPINSFKDDIEPVAAAYDRIGFLVNEDYELRERTLDWIGLSILSVWEIVAPFINSERTDRSKPSRMFAYTYFEWLAKSEKKRKDEGKLTKFPGDAPRARFFRRRQKWLEGSLP